MHEICNVFDGLEHVNLYSIKNLKKVAEISDLEVCHYSTVISEITVINNYLDYENPYFGTYKKEALFGVLNEDYIFKNMLGYKIQIILRKINSY